MLNARIELRGEELFCADTSEGGISTVRRLAPEALARLKGWAEKYDKAVRSADAPALLEIGRDIAAFLDEGDRWLDKVLVGTIGEIALDIAVPGQPEERERILLETPWELLAPNGRFLAEDDERLFRVTRRLGGSGTPAGPEFRDLSLLFMAAEIEGQGVLNYDQEEAGILQATNGLPLNLMVEESGAIEFLGQRIAQDGPFEALHLSCHGDIVKGHPVLALEKPEGGLDLVAIARLSRAFGEEDKKPKLVFLSACRTGEHGAASAFVQSLVRSGVANAIGWDGSVNDADAIGFAATFYEELARGSSVAYAAARARGALLRSHLADPNQGRHWHLARAYSGPRRGGTLCASARPRRVFRRDAGYKEFLDLRQGRVPVASAAEFVGRRREAQRILRAFRDREHAGVLIHGLGRQGKSSLAARIANRMPGHDTVVIYERYDALAVFEALRNALPARLQRDFDQTWREQVTKDASNLQNALLDMLEGPFRTTDPATRAKPVLLIIDDLEQILETPKPGEANTPVKTAYSVALASIIAAFRDADTESRLLLTSRYTFGLTDARGDDLAARLVPVQLPPMDETQRDKQMRAAARLAGAEHAGDAAVQNPAALEARIKEAANGNPGLQAILSRPMLSGDLEATTKAVEAVESYLESGEVPEDSHAAADFFTHVSPTAFKDMLTPQETEQLRAATLFSVPVPRPVLEAAGKAVSVKVPVQAIERLRGLGLIDLYLAAGAKEELAVNALVRPLVPPLSEGESAQIAERAIAPLYSGWKDADGDLPADQRGLEAARLTLLGQAPPKIVNASSRAAVVFLFRTVHQAEPALDLVLAALSALDRTEATPDLHLLRHGADCAERLGKTEIQEMLLERGLAIEGGDPRGRARLLFARASRLIQTGRIDAAEELLKEAASVFESLRDVRSRAVTMGQIADILQARGQLDEALKIRTDEELPVYERLGDVRERAVTMGKIADILQARGQLDEALKIRNEEQLPVYERLGDVRSRAVTMGQIADILQARGQLDEALKIRTDEELPVYERLGDVRSLLVGRANLAITLLQRAKDGDRDEAGSLLSLALEDARRLDLSEAQQIEQVIEQAGFGSMPTQSAEDRPLGGESEDNGSGVQGYSPDQGWDACTGLGSPDGTKLLDLLDQSPSTDLTSGAPTTPHSSPVRGISEGPGQPAITLSSPTQADKAEYTVWYGTNRRPNDPGGAGKGYSGGRDTVVHYGSCRVFIPQSHKIGSLGSPWWKRLLTLTDDRLRLRSVNEFEQSAYWSGIAAQLAAIDVAERCAVVFVHGYNVSFQDAALRAAQIGFDLSVKGAMAFFSWPSQGSTGGYPADEATIEASEGVIADFMTDFAERSGAAAVHIIAHSMGNRGVLRAVNRIAAKAERRTGKPFGQVILAAADVDADVFRQLSAAYAEVASRTTLYVSKRDLAVEASRWLHNFPRAGLMPPTLVLPGIDTINVTNVDLTMLGHGYVAEARDVLTDMHALITQGAPPDKRFGLREAKNEEGERYWLIGA